MITTVCGWTQSFQLSAFFEQFPKNTFGREREREGGRERGEERERERRHKFLSWNFYFCEFQIGSNSWNEVKHVSISVQMADFIATILIEEKKTNINNNMVLIIDLYCACNNNNS